MDITDEILAAYVDGTLPDECRDEVRQYIAVHPEELEQVVKMMDNYPTDVSEEEPTFNVGIGSVAGAVACGGIGATIASSGAAFVSGLKHHKSRHAKIRKTNIQANITNLLNELL